MTITGTVVTSKGNLPAGGPRLRVEAGQKDNEDGNEGGGGGGGGGGGKMFKLNKIAFDSEGKVYGEMTMKTSKNSKLYFCAEDGRYVDMTLLLLLFSLHCSYSSPPLPFHVTANHLTITTATATPQTRTWAADKILWQNR